MEGGDSMYKEIINGIEYRLVTIGNRSKLISANGDAINPIRRNQKCTTHLSKDGYPCVGGGIPVHMYVAKGWVDGYFEGAEVNHLDYDRTNFKASNLEWVTHLDNVRYSSNEDRYAKPTGSGNPNYGNDTLKKKLEANPELKKQYYSHPGVQNGRATSIRVYDMNMKLVKEFELIKDCAEWICKLFNKDLSKIPHIQSTISTAIKNDKPYRGFKFYK